jgi:uncharacterized protein with NAD-binding domain and iron-sulfur cluster
VLADDRSGNLCLLRRKRSHRAPFTRIFKPMTTVAVFGGGVGGLSAAHELVERDFQVSVYEGREFGGKARSIPVSNTATPGRRALPGEHGFRFFPGFYRHLPDTMARIPDGKGHTVVSHLREVNEMMLAQGDGRGCFKVPTDPTASIDDIAAAIEFMWQFNDGVDIPPDEMADFLGQLLLLLTSCDARRYGQWEQMSWWDFTGQARSPRIFRGFSGTG